MPNVAPAEQLIDICLGPARSQCIYLFARLDLADRLGDGPMDYRVLASAANVEPEPLYRLLRALAWLDVVTESAPGVFALSTLGRPLSAAAEDSVRAHVLHMNEEMYVAWGQSFHSLQTGTSAFGRIFGVEYFPWLAAHPEKEANAHRAMNDTQRSVNDAVVRSFDFSRAKVVCDVGGGHGALLSAILIQNPDLHGILFDLDSGLAIARSGVGGPLPRCELVSGDFFVEVPEHADIYLLKLVLHDWTDAEATKILKNIRRAMKDNARLLVIESLRLDWPEVSIADLWSIHMLVNTGGKERSQSELCSLAGMAGLKHIKKLSIEHNLIMNEFVRED